MTYISGKDSDWVYDLKIKAHMICPWVRYDSEREREGGGEGGEMVHKLKISLRLW